MPRDNDKNNDSRGRRDRPSGGKGRSGAPGDRRRNSPSAASPARATATSATASGALMPGSPTAPNPMARSPIPAPANPTPASARVLRRAAMQTLRAVITVTRSRPRALQPATTAPAATIAVAKSARTPRAAIARCPTGRAIFRRKFGEKKPYAPREAAARSDPIRRAAKAFRKDGDRPQRRSAVRRPSRSDRRRENLAATRNFRAAGIAERIGKIAVPIAVIQSRGRSATQVRADHAGRNSRATRWRKRSFDKPRFDKPRYDKPREDRGGDERPRFSRPREDRPAGDRPFRERPKFDRPREDREDRPKFERPAKAAAPGRSIRAATRDPLIATPIGHAATTRTTARSSPSVRRSAAAASIASARPTSGVRRGLRAKRNPASASPRWCRGPVSPRAATPRNGSCRAASRSTAA